MSVELTRIGLAGLSPSDWPERSAVKYLRSGFVWLPAALIAGLGAWTLLSGYAGRPAESEPVRLAAAAVAEPAPPPAVAPVPSTAEGEAIAPEETAPVDGLKISSQYWRRGGLGSKALVTFTLRNSNDYAVKDIAISCAFSRRDGSHLTDRTRVIHDTVNMRGRKTFAPPACRFRQRQRQQGQMHAGCRPAYLDREPAVTRLVTSSLCGQRGPRNQLQHHQLSE